MDDKSSMRDGHRGGSDLPEDMDQSNHGNKDIAYSQQTMNPSQSSPHFHQPPPPHQIPPAANYPYYYYPPYQYPPNQQQPYPAHPDQSSIPPNPQPPQQYPTHHLQPQNASYGSSVSSHIPHSESYHSESHLNTDINPSLSSPPHSLHAPPDTLQPPPHVDPPPEIAQPPATAPTSHSLFYPPSFQAYYQHHPYSSFYPQHHPASDQQNSTDQQQRQDQDKKGLENIKSGSSSASKSGSSKATLRTSQRLGGESRDRSENNIFRKSRKSRSVSEFQDEDWGDHPTNVGQPGRNAVFGSLPTSFSAERSDHNEDFGASSSSSSMFLRTKEQKRLRKNALSRSQAANLKQKIQLIAAKDPSERTPEEVKEFQQYEERRYRKNKRSRDRAVGRKAEMDRIMAIPEDERTKEEKRYLQVNLTRKRNKNLGDKARRDRLKQQGHTVRRKESMISLSASESSCSSTASYLRTSLTLGPPAITKTSSSTSSLSRSPTRSQSRGHFSPGNDDLPPVDAQLASVSRGGGEYRLTPIPHSIPAAPPSTILGIGGLDHDLNMHQGQGQQNNRRLSPSGEAYLNLALSAPSASEVVTSSSGKDLHHDDSPTTGARRRHDFSGDQQHQEQEQQNLRPHTPVATMVSTPNRPPPSPIRIRPSQYEEDEEDHNDKRRSGRRR